MRDVVIAGYLRSAQSRSRPNDPGRDWLHKLGADTMLGMLLPELLKRTGVAPDEVDDFIVGCARGIDEQWTYGGRSPLFLANLSEKTAAKAVDRQCGSSMAAVHIAFMEILHRVMRMSSWPPAWST
jgi:acetyl-CoA acyltransferase